MFQYRIVNANMVYVTSCIYMQKNNKLTLKSVLMNSTQRYYFVDEYYGDTVNVGFVQ